MSDRQLIDQEGVNHTTIDALVKSLRHVILQPKVFFPHKDGTSKTRRRTLSYAAFEDGRQLTEKSARNHAYLFAEAVVHALKHTKPALVRKVEVRKAGDQYLKAALTGARTRVKSFESLVDQAMKTKMYVDRLEKHDIRTPPIRTIIHVNDQPIKGIHPTEECYVDRFKEASNYAKEHFTKKTKPITAPTQGKEHVVWKRPKDWPSDKEEKPVNNHGPVYTPGQIELKYGPTLMQLGFADVHPMLPLFSVHEKKKDYDMNTYIFAQKHVDAVVQRLKDDEEFLEEVREQYL